MWFLNYALAWTALSVVCLYNHFHTQGFVHVKIDKGILRGRNATTWRNQRYFSFKGVPYARPPIGELRFKGPLEEAEWYGVKDAVIHGPVCPHVDITYNVYRGQEDCLFLNVYTPSLTADRLPVMVWIHGGMFLLGSANDELWGPDYFVEAGVVLVSLNYRLGALGFLSTGDDGAPGNAGMKDQVAALRWVRRNIARFGGDPDNVTIFGASSSAACVQYHILSPMSAGLFTRAISHSGSVLNPWALVENAPEATIRLAQGLGAEGVAGNTVRALEFLRTASPEAIIRAQATIINKAEKRMNVMFLFSASVEKGVRSEEVFLPASPLDILRSGKFNKVPFMAGYASHEGNLFLTELEKPEMLKAAFEDTERYIPNDIKNPRLRQELAKSVRRFYFDDRPVGRENISNFANLYGDVTFNAGINRALSLQLQSSNTPIYFFVFAYEGGMNLIKFTLNIQMPGAVHGDELGYLFHHRLVFWKTPRMGSADDDMVNRMIRMWTNFARYGNPTPPGDPVTWKPVTINEFNYLNISGRDTKLARNPNPERSSFWARAYEKDFVLQH